MGWRRFIMLEIGTKAPDFSLPDQNGKIHTLSEYAGKKVILYFYPKDSTPGCTAEACDLRDNYQRFISLGYEILGVSKDSEASHRKFIEKYQLPFPLLSDKESEVQKAYDAWGLKKFMGREFMGTLRKTFVIDENGVIVDIIEKVNTKAHTQQLLK